MAEPVPALPPYLSERHQTVDELAADLKKSPFFMTSLDDAGDEDNPELDAIRALIYEGSRAEIAGNFKEQGNEMARSKQWKDGKEQYTKGLAALKVERKAEDPDGEEEDRKEKTIKEALLANRALCHLELRMYVLLLLLALCRYEMILTLPIGNYRSCTLDCMAAIEISPSNVKAHYRLASALFALNKLPEAHSACFAGLELDSGNKPLLVLAQNVTEKRAAQAIAEKKRQEQEDRVKEEAAMLKKALMIRTIRTRTTGNPPEMEDAAIKLVPDPLSATSTLTFPVVILYPLHLQSDFIKAFGEEQTLQGHLDYLLPLPWDTSGEYAPKEIEAYLETVGGGLVKWGKKVELLKVLSASKVEVVDGMVRVNLVPKRRASEWIEAVKKRKSVA